MYRVCRLAVDEVIQPHLCRVCGGRGFIMITRKDPHRRKGKKKDREPKALRVDCEKCGGEGFFAWRPFTRARAAGIGRWRWQHVWNVRYRDILLPIVTQYESVFIGAFRRRLG